MIYCCYLNNSFSSSATLTTGRKCTVSSQLIMQILHLGIIILTSISSTSPLSWPPVNHKCQITHVDCGSLSFGMIRSGLPQTQQKINWIWIKHCILHFKYYSSNTSSQEKSYSIWTLRISLGNHFTFISPENSSPQNTCRLVYLLKVLFEDGYLEAKQWVRYWTTGNKEIKDKTNQPQGYLLCMRLCVHISISTLYFMHNALKAICLHV